MTKQLTMLSLFSGIGGIDLAGKWAGIKTVGFCEIDPFCQKVLKKHWPGVPLYSDIRAIRGEDIGTVDIIAGGFPCQPFSQAGKRKASEDNKYLWHEMFRVIKEVKPKWIVGENVIGIINLELDKVLSDLESENYTCEAFVLPACGVGAWHRRYRVFIVAYSAINRNWIPQREIQTGWDIPINCSWWSSEPELGRLVHGVPTKLDKSRLRALGNAVVPQQIFPILNAIATIEVNKK